MLRCEKKITALQYVTGYSVRSSVGGFGTLSTGASDTVVNSGISGKI